jgi:hypothetical protein
MGEDRRAFGPRDEGVSIDSGLHGRARARQRLAQIELWRQLAHRLLPGGDFGRPGRLLQPAGQRFLPGLCPGNRQQLEQRAAAEQIQVGRVQVAVVAEALARFAAASPAIFDARQAALVEGDRPLRRVARSKGAVVLLQHADEAVKGNQTPPAGNGSLPDGRGKSDGESEGRQAGIAQAGIGPHQGDVQFAPGLQALAIVIGGHGDYSRSDRSDRLGRSMSDRFSWWGAWCRGGDSLIRS